MSLYGKSNVESVAAAGLVSVPREYRWQSRYVCVCVCTAMAWEKEGPGKRVQPANEGKGRRVDPRWCPPREGASKASKAIFLMIQEGREGEGARGGEDRG